MLDAGRVRQIVGNLVSNAIKFTETGSIKTIVAMHERSDGNFEITISVIDTGPGVPDDVAETIFAAFEQAPGATSRGGAGLGLFISRRLARMMGGDLTLEPARRNGAHFRLTLTAGRAGALHPEPEPVEPAPEAWRGLQVLCVDDNDKNRRIAELLLGQLGFSATLAASGGEALDVSAMRRFDLVLMDIVMPDLDGIQTLLAMRGDTDSLNRMTPAIALTAKLSPDDLEAYREAGFEGVSAKPVDIGSLTHEIARVLAARNSTIKG
jgi:CheY-like chemotaxis protein